MAPPLEAGAATADVTPGTPCFLHGYPHVARVSTGTHDPLLASALYVRHGASACLFVAVDVILISKAIAARVRRRIAQATGVDEGAIVVSATHTHSGPVVVDYLSNEADSVVPKADPDYVRHLETQIVAAAVAAWNARRPAEMAFVRTDGAGVGTNRHSPNGPRDLAVPVLAVRDAQSLAFIGIMLVCAMHPTVLHEDSTLFSGDFPAFARQHLQARFGGCPVIYHTGAAGDQSPRHVTRGNTFAEAQRLGDLLGAAVAAALAAAPFTRDAGITFARCLIELPLRVPPPLDEAERQLQNTRRRLDQLRRDGAPRPAVRSAECDWFGAEETVALSRAAQDGRLHAALASCLPAEIQVFAIGPQLYVCWPGEFFVEFALRLKRKYPYSTVITLANGELQGYVVTQQAIDNHWYEAGNALLQSPQAGDRVVAATMELLAGLPGVVHA